MPRHREAGTTDKSCRICNGDELCAMFAAGRRSFFVMHGKGSRFPWRIVGANRFLGYDPSISCRYEKKLQRCKFRQHAGAGSEDRLQHFRMGDGRYMGPYRSTAAGRERDHGQIDSSAGRRGRTQGLARDYSGRKISGVGTPPFEAPIDTQIFKARPDVEAIAHAHAPMCIVLRLV